MFVQTIRILAIATVGGSAARLHVGNAIRRVAEYAEKSFRVHGACTDFDIVRLLKDAATLAPKFRKLQNQILKGQALLLLCTMRTRSARLKFYFNFQAVSKSSLTPNFFSV